MTSQALNRPVDVLAVMQSAKYRCDCRPGVDHCTPCLEMGAARAAVAELAASAEMYQNCVDTEGEPSIAVSERLRSAIASIGTQP